MKKLLSISTSKMYLACALGLAVTIGSFWHHQVNQSQLDRMNVLSAGTGTCFNRVSQTFTAFMIKDLKSPYLNSSFMALSNECLSETVSAITPFRKDLGKGFETLNQLVSEVHWFHEKLAKVASAATPLEAITDRFGKMETFKISLIDEIDEISTQLRDIQVSDEYLMGSGLILFVLALSILSLKDYGQTQKKRDLEKQAINFLKAGNANVGAIVDQLVDKALNIQGLNVTAQIFRDYHEDILTKMNSKNFAAPGIVKEEDKAQEIQETNTVAEERTSLKEILVSIQNHQAKDTIHTSEVRDVQLNISFEIFEQMMSSGISQLMNRRDDHKKIMISNQIHSDRSIINLFLAGKTFTASELEYACNEMAIAQEIDMNLVILKEMVSEAGAQWYLENKTDRSGNITGMNIRFTVMRASKEVKKNLVSIIRGKKKDIVRELMN